eukprot:m.130018 g.130018  ORF g.130018 m.130018 type:complete len:222 (-) comp11274_c1_seq2:309-974(-)
MPSFGPEGIPDALLQWPMKVLASWHPPNCKKFKSSLFSRVPLGMVVEKVGKGAMIPPLPLLCVCDDDDDDDAYHHETREFSVPQQLGHAHYSDGDQSDTAGKLDHPSQTFSDSEHEQSYAPQLADILDQRMIQAESSVTSPTSPTYDRIGDDEQAISPVRMAWDDAGVAAIGGMGSPSAAASQRKSIEPTTRPPPQVMHSRRRGSLSIPSQLPLPDSLSSP